LERDDEQLLRHNTRQLADFLSVFYDELRDSGLSRRLAERLTVAQYMSLNANGQAETIARLLDGLNDADMNGDS